MAQNIHYFPDKDKRKMRLAFRKKYKNKKGSKIVKGQDQYRETDYEGD